MNNSLDEASGFLQEPKSIAERLFSGKSAKKSPHHEQSSKGLVSTLLGSSPKKIFGFGKKKDKHKDRDDNLEDIISSGKKYDESKGEFVPYEERLDEDSEEWRAFQQMQSRIQQTVSETQKNLNKLEKTSSITESSTIEVTGAVKPPPGSWVQFEPPPEEHPVEENATSTDNRCESPELDLTVRLPASLQNQPAPPQPPQNTPRVSIDDLDEPVDGTKPYASTADLLGLDINQSDNFVHEPTVKMNSDLLGLDSVLNSDEQTSGFSSDLLYADHQADGASGRSSGAASPVSFGKFDIHHVPAGSSVSDRIVDDFLGIAETPEIKPAAELDLFKLSGSDNVDGGSDSSALFFGINATKAVTPCDTDDFDDFLAVRSEPLKKDSKLSADVTDGSVLQPSIAKSSSFDPFDTSKVTKQLEETQELIKREAPTVDSGGMFTGPAYGAQPTNNDLFDAGNANDTVDAIVLNPVQPVASGQLFSADNSSAVTGGDIITFLTDIITTAEPPPIADDNPSVSRTDDFFSAKSTAPNNNDIGQQLFMNESATVEPGSAKAKADLNDWVDFSAMNDSKAGVDFNDMFFDPRSGNDDIEVAAVGDVSDNIWGTSEVQLDAGDDNTFTTDLFTDAAATAFFTQVDDLVCKNPFASDVDTTNTCTTADLGLDLETNAKKKNPFIDSPSGGEDSSPEVDKAAISFHIRAPDEEHQSSGTFDIFQTIHPASSDEHPNGLGHTETYHQPIARPKPNITAAPAMAIPPPPKIDAPPRFNPFNEDSSETEGEDEPEPESDFADFDKMPQNDGVDNANGESVVTVPLPPLVDPNESSDSEVEPEHIDLGDFHPKYELEGYELMLRQPSKKKLTANRFWKQVYVRLHRSDANLIIKIYDKANSQATLQELPLQACYSLSEETLQHYDQFGKIHTVKIQYVFYKERVGIRPERITPQNLQNLVRKPKPTMILDHAPQTSELLKFGSLREDLLRSFIWEIEDALMKLDVHRDKTLSYTKDEVSAEVWDEFFCEIDKEGHIIWKKARVRIFVLAFVTGMPACELGINDKRRRGREVVGRHDIIPVKTEEWIRIQDCEFHSTVDITTYEKSRTIRFHPLDACQFELMRFRVPLKENKELPLQIHVKQKVTKSLVEIRADVIIPGYYSSNTEEGQVPCEDIQIRFPIPESWIYLFRIEKRFGYGSVKSATRKPGKIKGIERLTMMAQGFATPSLIEVDVGSAKYEHIHRAIVWRVARLPERHHGAYKTHLFVCRIDLGAHDDIPEMYEKYAEVEYTMPGSTVSRTAVRSISVDNPNPPEKWVRYIAKYEYKVEIDHTHELENVDMGPSDDALSDHEEDSS
ncbi:uncharacterized protein LOC141912249 [Tubulanus polymorphus]|uniref:uncharacterized protein LOC141912249 n=1 Tax=Tubulanus polymorphus TaxID=672921 RepID=UPI003DA30374